MKFKKNFGNHYLVDLPEAECSIHKQNNSYSNNTRYRDLNLTYKMTMAAFDALQMN